jgi:hypothetical protein
MLVYIISEDLSVYIKSYFKKSSTKYKMNVSLFSKENYTLKEENQLFIRMHDFKIQLMIM